MNTQHTFTVEVTHDEETGYWIAECDELGVVTEALTYEELTARVWQIAPEMALANGFNAAPKTMCLRFEHLETA
jgi:hypothetical protein